MNIYVCTYISPQIFNHLKNSQTAATHDSYIKMSAVNAFSSTSGQNSKIYNFQKKKNS